MPGPKKSNASLKRMTMNWKSTLCFAILLPAGLSAQTNCNEGAGPIDPAQPQGIATAEIIRKFSAQESVLREAQTHYTYTQDVSVQTLVGEEVDGEFRRVLEISYSGGVRKENVKFAPQPTLRRISMSKQDFDDIDNRTPFVLNQEDLPQYNLLYAGRQKVDELETYVFDAAPKTLEPGKRYFQGRIWVEVHDLTVVKSCGKNVPDEAPQPQKKSKKKRNQQPPQENVSPTFVTYRELIDGKYWFPTYVRADEDLQFAYSDGVHVREVIKYQDYRRSP